MLELIYRTLQSIDGTLSDAIKAAGIAARQYGNVYRDLSRTRQQRRSGRHTPKQWQALKEFYNFTCLCCGKREPEIRLTKDHVDPRGTNDITNIQPLCAECNHTKSGAHIDYRGTDQAVQAIRKH